MTSSEELVIPDRCLVVFVDDTGHQALVPNHPIYGLGGCAVKWTPLAGQEPG
jgi:hypothetical protein